MGNLNSSSASFRGNVFRMKVFMWNIQLFLFQSSPPKCTLLLLCIPHNLFWDVSSISTRFIFSSQDNCSKSLLLAFKLLAWEQHLNDQEMFFWVVVMRVHPLPLSFGLFIWFSFVSVCLLSFPLPLQRHRTSSQHAHYEMPKINHSTMRCPHPQIASLVHQRV